LSWELLVLGREFHFPINFTMWQHLTFNVTTSGISSLQSLICLTCWKNVRRYTSYDAWAMHLSQRTLKLSIASPLEIQARGACLCSSSGNRARNWKVKFKSSPIPHEGHTKSPNYIPVAVMICNRSSHYHKSSLKKTAQTSIHVNNISNHSHTWNQVTTNLAAYTKILCQTRMKMPPSANFNPLNHGQHPQFMQISSWNHFQCSQNWMPRTRTKATHLDDWIYKYW
jgi:hypothetical protein